MVEQGRRPSARPPSSRRPAIAASRPRVAPLLAATHAQRALFATLARDGATAAMAERMTAFGELNALVGLDERYRRERDWLL
jgi:hypothetical protein